jgi:DNA-binding transcriptional LysR family regulator
LVSVWTARPVLDGVEGIEASLGRQSASPVGLVRVGVSGTASRFLAESLPSFADNPGLKVELVVSDRFGDMVEDRLDLALRIGEITDASLAQRRCGIFPRVVVAAASYIDRYGKPTTPADLASQTCIVLDVGPDSVDLCYAGRPQGLSGIWWISRQRCPCGP